MKKWIFLLRSFFPKWTFFDDVAPELRLEVCYGKNDLNLSTWTNALTPIRRSFKNLIINSHGSYLHACHNHLNHFNSDLTALTETDSETVSEMTTYKIAKQMASFQIEQRGLATRPFNFQFRLLVAYSNNQKREPDIILTSPIYEEI